MFEGDTSLHRGDPQFPSTCWSQLVVSAMGEGAPPGPYMESLAASYWRPVYAYIRRRWRKSNEDTKDLTQEFFAWVLSTDLLRRANPTRGSFRGFLKVCLENFLTDDARKEKRHKRGGGLSIVSLSAAADDDPVFDIADVGQRSPDEILDDLWRQQVLSSVVDGMEHGYHCEGRDVYFAVFRDFLLADAPASYEELSERFGIDKNTVSNYLQHAKRRYRDVLRQTLAETVESAEALQDEIEWFTGGVA